MLAQLEGALRLCTEKAGQELEGRTSSYFVVHLWRHAACCLKGEKAGEEGGNEWDGVAFSTWI
jgi:hypothetical protein